MSMYCRSYATAREAHAAVARLIDAGVPGGAVRVLMGEPPRDARDVRPGGYATSTSPDDPVGVFAGMARTARDGMGSYAGDAMRRGSYADADRDTITSFPHGIATQRVASHRALEAVLREVGLDPDAVDGLHAGSVLVLADVSDAIAATDMLDAA